MVPRRGTQSGGWLLLGSCVPNPTKSNQIEVATDGSRHHAVLLSVLHEKTVQCHEKTAYRRYAIYAAWLASRIVWLLVATKKQTTCYFHRVQPRVIPPQSKNQTTTAKRRGATAALPHESIGWNPLPVSDAPSVHDSRGSPTAALPIQSTITKVPINVKRAHGGFSGPLLPP
mmetsp:Transcript_17450/g.17546  ORF Transcript_17450/g.17546 Transcript_17450/m.17546 type:complete len:172 (-) Transcript_17450:525-1040(-)